MQQKKKTQVKTSKIDKGGVNLPNHICIIPNGNRTWARKNGLSDAEGHRIGVEMLVKLTKHMREREIHTASVWGSSTENFNTRSPKEMRNLIRLLKYVIETWAPEAHTEGARLIHIGRRDRLPKRLASDIAAWEEKTKNNTKHVINLAFDYGGHDELFRAMKKAFEDIQSGKISFDDLRKETGTYQNKYPYHYFKKYLDTRDQPYPYPDLIIRAAGEERLSGWMPWQSVYAEFVSVDKLFPEFEIGTIDDAIVEYQRRNRKFGGN